MTTEWLADHAHQAFREFLTTIKLGEDINEAATRLRLIDDILFKVLQWDKNQVSPEPHVKNVGYLDYEFNNPRPSLILEAKRVDAAFILPGHEYPAEPVPFSLISTECKEAAAALTQCQNYANQRGARYSAISNGHQWLLSMTFVPNQPVEDRMVYVFESFDAINKKFRAFFDCFGPLAIRSNQPSMKLLDTRRAPAPAKFSTTIPGYPVNADRNTLAPGVGGLLQLIWEAIDGDQDNELFLKNCYIPSAPRAIECRLSGSIIA